MPAITGSTLNPIQPQKLAGDPAALSSWLGKLAADAATGDVPAINYDLTQVQAKIGPVLADYVDMQGQIAQLQGQLNAAAAQLQAANAQLQAQAAAPPAQQPNQSVTVAQPANPMVMYVGVAAVAALGLGIWWLMNQQKKQGAHELAAENPKPKRKFVRRISK